MHTLRDIGVELVSARKARGLTQRDLAERLGIKQPQVARWESSAYRTASLARVSAVAQVLEVAVTPLAFVAEEAPAAYPLPATDTMGPTPVRDLGEVISRLRKHREELVDRYSMVAVGVFGSFATGEQTADSDVDLLVELSDVTGFEFVQAARRIEDVLGRSVDLVRPDILKDSLRDRVMREVVDVWRP